MSYRDIPAEIDALAARMDRLEVALWGEKRRPMTRAEKRACDIRGYAAAVASARNPADRRGILDFFDALTRAEVLVLLALRAAREAGRAA